MIIFRIIKEFIISKSELFIRSTSFSNFTILKDKFSLISSKISYNELKFTIKTFCIILLIISMIIHVPNKNTLIIDEYKLKCCIGKKGLNSNKKEGDFTTPMGVFHLKNYIIEKIVLVLRNAK